MQRQFSVFEALATGTQRVFDNFRLFFLASVLFFGISSASVFGIALFILQSAGTSFDQVQTLWKAEPGSPELQPVIGAVQSYALLLVLCVFIAIVIGLGLAIGYTKMSLEVFDRGTSSVSRLFSCFRLVPKVLLAAMLYGAMVSLGSLMFVLPGVYMTMRCILFIYFIIDKNAGSVESLKLSYAATAGSTWHVFALFSILASINLVVPFMGLFIMPISACAWSYVYRALTIEYGRPPAQDIIASV